MDVGISKEEKATPVRVILRDEAKDIRVWFRLLWLHCQVESGICISYVFSWCLGAFLFSYMDSNMVLKRDKIR